MINGKLHVMIIQCNEACNCTFLIDLSIKNNIMSHYVGFVQ